jgi:hypothetical protein
MISTVTPVTVCTLRGSICTSMYAQYIHIYTGILRIYPYVYSYIYIIIPKGINSTGAPVTVCTLRALDVCIYIYTYIHTYIHSEHTKKIILIHVYIHIYTVIPKGMISTGAPVTVCTLRGSDCLVEDPVLDAT